MISEFGVEMSMVSRSVCDYALNAIGFHDFVRIMSLKSFRTPVSGSRVSLRKTVAVASHVALSSQVRKAGSLEVNVPEKSITEDFNVLNKDGEVKGFARKLDSVEEFYAIVSECNQFEVMGQIRFEYLKLNLHLYNFDREIFVKDRAQIEAALSKGYMSAVRYEGKSILECDVVALYDMQRKLKPSDRCVNYKDLCRLRLPISNKVKKKFMDYVERLFPRVEEECPSGSSNGVSSMSIADEIGELNIAETRNSADVVEYDSDLDTNLIANEGEKDSESSLLSGRKRKQVEHFVSESFGVAKIKSFKKILPKNADIEDAVDEEDEDDEDEDQEEGESGDEIKKTINNDVKFIYIDISEEAPASPIPAKVINELKDFLKRISPDQYGDVIKLLKSHAVDAPNVNTSL